VTAPAAAPLPGYVCVVSKRHVVEPFHLSDAESAAFWADCMHISKALAAALEPSKMNYEIHGNTIPHLHLHLYPRYPGDPYAGRPIDGHSTQFERSQEDLDRIRRAIAP
jgi:diadenosine tetraphosphate (Ap4A) HIT family hydrolase